MSTSHAVLRAVLLALPLLAAPVPRAAAQCCDALSVARSSVAAAAAGGQVLFAGGFDGIGSTGASEVVDLYDSPSGTWSSAQLTISRYGIGGAGVGTLAMFAGGGFSSPTFQIILQDRVDVYDTSSGLWSTDSLSVPRIWPAGTSVGTLALFAGGNDTGVPPLGVSDVVDLYDSVGGTWSTASLSQARSFLTATSVAGTALFAGGFHGTGASDVVDLYDSTTGLWSTATLSTARYDLAATSAGSFALFAGGAEFGGPSDVVDIYDASTGLWSTATLSLPRTNLAAVAVGERAFFAGGTLTLGPVSTPSARVDVFDAATGSWSSFELCEARHWISAGAAGGVALFAGGRAQLETTTVDRLPVGFPRAYCFGDGSGGACPCGNTGAPDRGCAHSGGVGSRLDGAGCTSVVADGLVLSGRELVAGQPVLAFAGLNATAGGDGFGFGDGLRCAGGGVVRLGTKSVEPDGSVVYGPGLGGPGGWVAGDVRRFQLWFRDPSGPCNSGFNLTNGLEVQFAP